MLIPPPKCWVSLLADCCLMVMVAAVVPFLSLINDMNIYFKRIVLYSSTAQFMCANCVCVCECICERHGMSNHQSTSPIRDIKP